MWDMLFWTYSELIGQIINSRWFLLMAFPRAQTTSGESSLVVVFSSCEEQTIDGVFVDYVPASLTLLTWAPPG